MLRAPAIV